MGLKIQGLITGELVGSMSEIFLNGGPKSSALPYGFDAAISMPDGTSFSGIRQPVPVWLITGGEKVILVDTGLGPVEELTEAYQQQGMSIFCYQKPEWNILNALAKAGVKPNDIDIVFHTHLHFDHIANNRYFEKAQFLIPDIEMPWALTPPHHMGAGPYLPQFAKHIKDIDTYLTLIGEEGEVIAGVRYFRLGAHSPGCTALSVQTDIGRVVLAGDVMLDTLSNIYDWPAGFYYRLDQFEPAYKRIREEADIIIPGHDWKVWHTYKNGIIG